MMSDRITFCERGLIDKGVGGRNPSSLTSRQTSFLFLFNIFLLEFAEITLLSIRLIEASYPRAPVRSI